MKSWVSVGLAAVAGAFGAIGVGPAQAECGGEEFAWGPDAQAALGTLFCKTGTAGSSAYAFCNAALFGIPIYSPFEVSRQICNSGIWFASEEILPDEVDMGVVSIQSEAENCVVTERAKSIGIESFWLSAVFDEEFDGFVVEPYFGLLADPLKYSNWGPGEPNNFLGEEYCSELITETGKWNDINCFAPRLTVCEVQCNDNNVCTNSYFDIWGTRECKHDPIFCNDNDPCTIDACDPKDGCVFPPVACEDGNPCTVGVCDSELGCSQTIPAIADGTSGYVACALPTDWESARSECESRGMHLATIEDSSENQMVADFVGLHDAEEAWIGANDQGSEGNFQWVGPPSGFSSWCPGEPNDIGGEDCTHIGGCTPDGWNDAPCEWVKPFVCETDCDDSNPCTIDSFDPDTAQCVNEHSPDGCSDGNPCTVDTCDPTGGCITEPAFATFDGHGYLYCPEIFDFDDAREACIARGMNLVTVDSPEENTFLVELAGEYGANSAWIGYTDALVEGEFGWVGAASTYEQWCSGEPNDTGDGEDCTQFGFCDNGGWNDASCATPLPFVCEFDETGPDTDLDLDLGLYLMSVSPSASEANATRDLQVFGGLFSASAEVSVEALPLSASGYSGVTKLTATLEIAEQAGVYDVTVYDGGTSVTLPEAFRVMADGFCGGLSCGACSSDMDCVEGDTCTQDYCISGGCVHVPRSECCGPTGCEACTVGGDLTGNDELNVTDVQCGVLLTLWDFGGKTTPVPTCQSTPVAAADLDCDGSASVTDLQLLIQLTISGFLDSEVDEDGNGCHDACSQ